MKKTIKVFAAILTITILVFSCQSNERKGRPPKMDSRQMQNEGPAMGQRLPVMRDKNIDLCMKVISLKDTEDEAVKLSAEQIDSIKTAIASWKTSIESDEKAESDDYVALILDTLSKEQLKFILTSNNMAMNAPSDRDFSDRPEKPQGHGGGEKMEPPKDGERPNHPPTPGDDKQATLLRLLGSMLEELN
ncbi:MAG: hypothetical protein PQJ46_15755 [Spirochaetales bacterium]|nr:hypothetical protein [Spirochaetales bacterium]